MSSSVIALSPSLQILKYIYLAIVFYLVNL